MVVHVDVAPALLRWAVERAGWDEETTARRAPQFTKWVRGETRPTLKQLETFAKNTHAPFGFLFLPEPPDEPLPIPDMRTIGNVGVLRPSVDLLDTIYLCQRRQDWYRDYASDNGAEPLDFVGSATLDTPPARVAGDIAERLDFGVEERQKLSGNEKVRRGLIDRIENIGVLVMVNGVVGADTHRKLDPAEFRGFALSDPLAPLIFVNGADAKAAQLFTLVHELAHIWLGRSALSEAAMDSREGRTEEQWCNSVAAEVLLPLNDLRSDYGGQVTVEELERLAKRYKVSTLVVLKRIFDAGFLTWDEYTERYRGEYERVMSLVKDKNGDSGGGNYYKTQPLRLSRQFAKAVISSTLEGSTTYREAYQLLGTKKHATFEGLAEELRAA
ncbi:ImmA/IrrE family metallo-endopeptidase [Propionibacterium acidifaciens]|uniref:ImmA/IrrE family metallo-endopeptidase n=1 Tax=Propionibacterium acidifaciens TaxID=556499 RepID=UPI00041EB496|nr:ImmA/IrrE family metallo-endopeptidase [Propionibacterium acidifaciens]